MLAEGHPCDERPPLVAHPPRTPHLPGVAEGVVPSTTTRRQAPRSGRRKEAETSARDSRSTPWHRGFPDESNALSPPHPQGPPHRARPDATTNDAFPLRSLLAKPPMLAAGHPCDERPPLVAHPPWTPHRPRVAEGVVPSTTTRGQRPRSGRRKEAETSARGFRTTPDETNAHEPYPPPRPSSSGKARCHNQCLPLRSMLAKPSMLAEGHPCVRVPSARSAPPLDSAPSPWR
jgi:hypothetical protein